MNIALKAALEGRQEMAFWPAAVMWLLYSESPTQGNLGYLFLLSFTGALMFATLKRGKSYIGSLNDTRENLRRNRNRESRNTDSKEIEEQIDDLIDAFKAFSEYLLPNSGAFWIVSIGILVNFGFSLWLFYILFQRVIVSAVPNPAELGLFMLPILWIFVVISTIISKM